MVLAVLYFDVQDPEGFMGVLPSTRGLFEDVPGFHGFEVRRGIENDQVFLVTAEWDTVDDHTRWQADHAVEFLESLGPYIVGPPDIKHFA